MAEPTWSDVNVNGTFWLHRSCLENEILRSLLWRSVDGRSTGLTDASGAAGGPTRKKRRRSKPNKNEKGKENTSTHTHTHTHTHTEKKKCRRWPATHGRRRAARSVVRGPHRAPWGPLLPIWRRRSLHGQRIDQ